MAHKIVVVYLSAQGLQFYVETCRGKFCSLTYVLYSAALTIVKSTCISFTKSTR